MQLGVTNTFCQQARPALAEWKCSFALCPFTVPLAFPRRLAFVFSLSLHLTQPTQSLCWRSGLRWLLAPTLLSAGDQAFVGCLLLLCSIFAAMAGSSSARKRAGKGADTDAAIDAKKTRSASSSKKGTQSKAKSGSSSRFAIRLVLLVVAVACLYYAGRDLIRSRFKPIPSVDQTDSPDDDGYAAFQEQLAALEKEPLPEFSEYPPLPYSLPPVRPLPDFPIRGAAPLEQEAIIEAFMHSWSAYKRDAWGYDEYHPLSKSGSNLSGEKGNGMGYTIIDSLSSLILMGLREEYEAARDWVQDELSWDVPGRMNVFETTIRTLGGLLSASALIRDPPHPLIPASDDDADLFLRLASSLADRLLPAFDTPTGIPLREVDLVTGEAFADIDNNNSSSLAEATTLQLEFKYLAELTGNEKYWRIAERPMQVVRKTSLQMRHYNGILPIFLSPQTGAFFMSDIRLGSRGDSYYEYLIKQWLQTGRSESVYREMYDFATQGIKHILTRPSIKSKPPLLYTSELTPRMGRDGRPAISMVPKQDHLVCFLGGAMMIGASSKGSDGGWTSDLNPPLRQESQPHPKDVEDWRVGHELIRTCVDTYIHSRTGLAPEIAFFRVPQDPPRSQEVDWFIKK